MNQTENIGKKSSKNIDKLFLPRTFFLTVKQVPLIMGWLARVVNLLNLDE